MNALEQPILQVLDAYKRAVFSKDVDAFVALYDRDVRVFDMWGEWSYSGVDAWRAMVQGWFSSLGDDQVIVAFNDVQIVTAQEFASATAFITYASVSVQGVTLRSMQNRITMVLKQTGHLWKIAHEHSSAPIDFETAKVILTR